MNPEDERDEFRRELRAVDDRVKAAHSALEAMPAQIVAGNIATVRSPEFWAALFEGLQKSTKESAGLDASYRVNDPASPLVNAGVFAGYNADSAGVQRWNPPAVGAYEYQRARPSRFP